ncbi:hypothetical protein ACF0H5_005958 [Mactra antiquata]
MDWSSEVTKLDGTKIDMDALDRSFDTWVHTDRKICITSCSPDSLMAEQMKNTNQVYPITRYIRGRVLLLSNAKYQALRLLQDIFTQMNYKVKIETEKSADEIRSIIEKEAQNEDNKFVDSFLVIVYGTPDTFEFGYIPEYLNDHNAPNLAGKPKLLYVIGDDDIVRQIEQTGQTNKDPDFLSMSTGFNGVMFYMFILCQFAHELSAQEIWRVLLQSASFHNFAASTHYTMMKQFYFFPGLTSSVLPNEVEILDPGDMYLYQKMLQYGTVKNYNVRLMFVGLKGAGKTSTTRRMMEQDIDDVTSTDGIDVHIGRCKIDIRNRKWEPVPDSKGSVSNERLRLLQFIDDDSRSNVPDIKHLEENPSGKLASRDTNQPMDTDDVFKDQAPVIPGSSPLSRSRSACSSKRSRDEFDDDNDDDSSSLSSSQSSISNISGFEHLNMDSSPSPSSVSSSEYDMFHDQDDVIDDVQTTDSMRRARRVIEQSGTNTTEVIRKEASVSLWDFAGQFVYYATHQLFFSPRAIYVLVLDMTDDLDKTLDNWYLDMRGRESIEVKGGINFWLRSIFTYAKGCSVGVPPMVMVGTHADELNMTRREKEVLAKSYFGKIRKLFQGSSLANNIRHEYFLLDNSSNNELTKEEMDKLKDYILSIAETSPYWGENIPAKWLELEQALEEIKMGGKPFITMNQLRRIDDSLASPIGEYEQLQLYLRVNHEAGNLIYFSDSHKLNDIVILDPQWIINAFKSLIGATEFSKKYGSLQRQWDDFDSSAKLKKGLAKRIWELDETSLFVKNSDVLLDVLEKLDIIATAMVLGADGYTVRPLDYYYVPCMLKQKAPRNLLENNENAIQTPVLCLKFKDDFLPPALFSRLVAHCMGKWPLACNGPHILLYCGFAMFAVNFGKGEDLHRLTLFAQNSKICMKITRYSSKTKSTNMVDPNICDRVRRYIASAVRKEFTRFHIPQPGDTQFTYVLQCKETNKNIEEDGFHRQEDLIEAIGTDFFCCEHSDEIHPHHMKTVEMVHEWFRDKIPPNIRLESPLVLDTWLQNLPKALKDTNVTDRTISRLSGCITGSNWIYLPKQLKIDEVTVEHVQENFFDNVRNQIFQCLYTWTMVCEKQQGKKPTNGLLLEAMKQAADKGLIIDWEEVQNIYDDI